MNIGFLIDEIDPTEAAKSLANITLNDISEWQLRMTKLPKDVYQYTTEAESLGKIIKQL